jgi:Protein of unknown function (DUF2511)
VLSLLVLAALGSGCGAEKSADQGAEIQHAEGYISRAQVGEAWPLTVKDGILHCDGSGALGALTFETNGRVYAVNEAAKLNGTPPIDLILASVLRSIHPPRGVPYFRKLKKNISPLIDRGMDLCRYERA